MKTLIAAFFLALVAIVVVFIVLSLLGVEHTVAGPIAGTIIGGVPYIRESLEKYLTARAHPQGLPVLSLGQFGLPPQRLVFYGALVLFAAMLLASSLGGIVSVFWSVELHQTVKIFTLMIVFPTAFLIGRWVGHRSVANGLLTIFLIGLFARTAGTLIDLIGVENFAFYLRLGFGEGYLSQHVALQIASGVVLFFVLSALGYWRGTRQQLGVYLNYLLKTVPDSTRHAIVDLAFEEAGRVSASKATVLPSNPAYMDYPQRQET